MLVFFYILPITAQFHIFCKPRCKPVNQMNATVKVLCYKSKTFSNGEHPQMQCVCKDNKRKYLSLGISVSAEHWDFKSNQPNDRCPNRERIIILIISHYSYYITFKYWCAGINFIDMAKLKYSNIQENQLVYNREKTKNLIITPLQEQAKQIIEKYNDGESAFVVPILSNLHKSDVQIANRLHKVLAKPNKHLKAIGIKLNLSIFLTSYVDYHSFATILKRAGVSTSIISESLEHSSEQIAMP